MDPKVASIRDINDWKRGQEEGIRLEANPKVGQDPEAMATLAGGIAHQFNNALVGITGNIELLKIDLPDNETVRRYIELMELSVRRMTHLTSQLLAYAEGGKYHPKDLCLADFVKESLSIIRGGIDPRIRVETDLQDEDCLVRADPTQLLMVLSALVANAAEAIEGTGEIRVLTRGEETDEELVKRHPGLGLGPHVCMMIQDNGKGMDEKTRRRVFEPFFTTKFQGRGLGMAAVYGIVRNHEGSISVESEPGKGTLIRVYLPAAEMPSEMMKAQTPW
jgi:signal transduction histidine kinase